MTKKKVFVLFLAAIMLFGMKTIPVQAKICSTCGVSADSRCTSGGPSSYQGTCWEYNGQCRSYLSTAKESYWICSGVTKHTERIQGQHSESYYHSLCSFYKRVCTY